MGAGEVKFFGQVLQKANLVEYEIDIKRIRKQSLVVGFADGSMKVDGKEIYTAKNLKSWFIQRSIRFLKKWN